MFYFAGHGHIDETGSYLLTSDSDTGNDGLLLANVIRYAHKSKARNKIIVLDSCFSDATGADVLNPKPVVD